MTIQRYYMITKQSTLWPRPPPSAVPAHVPIPLLRKSEQQHQIFKVTMTNPYIWKTTYIMINLSFLGCHETGAERKKKGLKNKILWKNNFFVYFRLTTLIISSEAERTDKEEGERKPGSWNLNLWNLIGTASRWLRCMHTWEPAIREWGHLPLQRVLFM